MINDEEYEKQGRPQLGDAQTLSKSDITQLNRLYNCPGSGIPGYLEVYVDRVENLSSFQPYVYIQAYDDQGRWQTLTAINSLTPTAEIANMLKFGDSIDRIKVSWQYISVSVKAYTTDGYVFQVIYPTSFSVNPGHQYRELCDYFFCTRQVFFSIFLGDSCSCFSGGTCLPDGTCVCSENSGGPYCQYARGRLLIFPRSATNLIQTNDTNGYYHLQFRAYEHTGFLTSVKGAFSTSDSTYVPNMVWNEKKLEYLPDVWSSFTVQAFHGSKSLSDAHTISFQSYVTIKNKRVKAFGDGIISFDYSFQPVEMD